ncbi:hypothetical protein E2C01_008720 [Portunus trituberculatus]|uniref:DDE Tnp4 domain-containing protein n=1 Tax=Portunus trituberculatus TaxID=210409 RepID=A0A5B7D4K7_PORTR|nr:hypothetical protein [Portunus trituberculatus]
MAHLRLSPAMTRSNLMTLSEVLKQDPLCFSSVYESNKTIIMATQQHQDLHLRNTFCCRDNLHKLSDAELIKRYCLDKDGLWFVTNLVMDALSSNTKRRKPLTPKMKGLQKDTSIVEWGMGELKLHFHVLFGKVLISPPVKVCKMVYVCAMLHLCKDRYIHIPIEEAQLDFEEQQHDKNCHHFQLFDKIRVDCIEMNSQSCLKFTWTSCPSAHMAKLLLLLLQLLPLPVQVLSVPMQLFLWPVQLFPQHGLRLF